MSQLSTGRPFKHHNLKNSAYGMKLNFFRSRCMNDIDLSNSSNSSYDSDADESREDSVESRSQNYSNEDEISEGNSSMEIMIVYSRAASHPIVVSPPFEVTSREVPGFSLESESVEVPRDNSRRIRERRRRRRNNVWLYFEVRQARNNHPDSW
jgi:hypothetical protein